MAVINIDLAPYDVVENKKGIKILDCAGSFLAKLEKPERICWSKYTCDWIETDAGEKIWFDLSYNDGEFVANTTLDIFIEWLIACYDAIESVGYEFLQHHDS
jgi:hypothetical protein